MKFKFSDFLDIVADYFDVKRSDILAEDRRRHIVEARHVAIYLWLKLSGRSYSGVAWDFGRDHTTVIHACQKVKDRPVDSGLLLRLNEARRLCK